MFAALSENQEFFKNKLNVAIMIAPVARVDRMTSKTLQTLKDAPHARAFLQSIGPELLPNPNVESSISAGWFKVTGMGNIGASFISDSDPNTFS